MTLIGVVGAGSIGRTLAAGFAELGHDIVINDTNPDVLQEARHPAWSKHEMARDCDYVIFTLPTPTTENGGDASTVDQALEAFSDTDATLILRSTMPPGSTRRLADKHSQPLVYTPEFLRDRSGVDDFYHPDRIVLAGPQPERHDARELFTHPEIQCDTYIETRDYLTAELGKEAHNAFFATKVSFANQMRVIAEAGGADPETVMDIVTADHRNTTSHLDPMLGPYGGKCLPKDTEALAHYGRETQSAPTPLLDGTIRMNEIAKENYEHLDIEGNWPDITVTSD